MASSALPALFPAVRLNREYFGDGAMRQSSPMSAALHLGAEKYWSLVSWEEKFRALSDSS